MKKQIILFFLIICLIPAAAQQQNGTFNFALVTDTHIGGATAEEDLRRTVRDINGNDSLAFVILSGDVTEFGSDSELLLAKAILDSLNKPWYIIPGNHDTKWSESGANSFRVIFGDEAFAFTHDGWLFLGTNSGPNMRMGPGQIPRENIVWLDSVLRGPGIREMKIVSVNHYPLDEGLNNWYELTDRLRQLDTRLALCGHGHTNRVMNFEGIPALMCRSNLRASAETGGYNIMTVTGDTLLTASVRHPDAMTLQGVAGGSKAKTMPTWATVRMERHDFAADTTSWPRPDYSMNRAFPGVKEVWRIQEKSDIGAGAVVAGKFAIITNTGGEIKALDIKNGREKWKVPTGAKIYSTPATYGRRVIVVSSDGMVRALALKSGRLLWSFYMRQPAVASPVTDGKRVYLTGSSGKCYALDITDGTVIWSNAMIDGFVETIPLIYRDMLIFGTWNNHLYALDTGSGEVLWDWHNGYSNRMLSPAACVPVAVNGRVFVVAPDRKMACLDASTGQLLWHSDLGAIAVRESMGITTDGTLILAKTMNGITVGVDAGKTEGTVVWKTGFDIGYDIAPGVVEEQSGVILIPSDKGVIHAASRDDGRLLWSHRISSCLINRIVPLASNGALCSSMDGVVVRIAY
ncbi:MAG: PQQ-binding-like beta-propeller repeat protein [Bacteroidales bacterium]|nr:PQQ-binding-like beta-propeller repeat protein [Bacteroidales bacterium]MDT8373988.1 PQQ-binding-like beta-propeller repeat protein [Bacteroidales bacterium]